MKTISTEQIKIHESIKRHECVYSRHWNYNIYIYGYNVRIIRLDSNEFTSKKFNNCDCIS